MNPIELLLAAASYQILRRNVGRCGGLYAAAAIIYAASYDRNVRSRMTNPAHRALTYS